jgi:hypothetical protein
MEQADEDDDVDLLDEGFHAVMGLLQKPSADDSLRANPPPTTAAAQQISSRPTRIAGANSQVCEHLPDATRDSAGGRQICILP